MELSAVLLDTHTWVWSLFRSSELSVPARDVIEQARTVYVAPCSLHEMAVLSGGLDWSHKDPFDRMIAATAMELACPLISRDGAFDELAGSPGWAGRLWESMPGA